MNKALKTKLMFTFKALLRFYKKYPISAIVDIGLFLLFVLTMYYFTIGACLMFTIITLVKWNANCNHHKLLEVANEILTENSETLE